MTIDDDNDTKSLAIFSDSKSQITFWKISYLAGKAIPFYISISKKKEKEEEVKSSKKNRILN